MGQETEVKRFVQLAFLRLAILGFIIVAVVMLAGCEPIVLQPTPPPIPTIKTTIWKEGKAAGIRLEFHHHYIPTDRDRHPLGYTTIDLNDVESIRAYREQVQATLKELTVMEDHMLMLEENKVKEAAHDKKDP